MRQSIQTGLDELVKHVLAANAAQHVCGLKMHCENFKVDFCE